MAKRKDMGDDTLAEKTTNVGTPAYMAPELMVDARDATYDSRLVDVYSFGILIWAVLTRTKPYGALDMNLWSLRDFIVQGGRPDYEQTEALETAGAPAMIVQLMKSCWSGTAAKRPGFDGVCEQLQAALMPDAQADGSGAGESLSCS